MIGVEFLEFAAHVEGVHIVDMVAAKGRDRSRSAMQVAYIANVNRCLNEPRWVVQRVCYL